MNAVFDNLVATMTIQIIVLYNNFRTIGDRSKF